LFVGDSLKHNAHAQAKADIDDAADGFEYFLVMGYAHANLRALRDGI
jgi:hypothetical protein